MANIRKKYTAWSAEAVLAEAKKYTNRTQFQIHSGGAYNIARAEGYLDVACAHISRKKNTTKLTYERVKAAAQQYTTRSTFYKGSPPEYRKAHLEGWLDDVCSHMPSHIGHKWNFVAVKREASRYQHRVDFMKKSQSAYKRALAEGWLDTVCKHMKPKQRHGVWTYQEVVREAKKYKYRSDFAAKSKGAYNAAKREDWLESVCRHMKPKVKCNTGA